MHVEFPGDHTQLKDAEVINKRPLILTVYQWYVWALEALESELRKKHGPPVSQNTPLLEFHC